jgi:hypothetical protein
VLQEKIMQELRHSEWGQGWNINYESQERAHCERDMGTKQRSSFRARVLGGNRLWNPDGPFWWLWLYSGKCRSFGRFWVKKGYNPTCLFIYFFFFYTSWHFNISLSLLCILILFPNCITLNGSGDSVYPCSFWCYRD